MKAIPDQPKADAEKFGRYDILEHIATGGMAKIYKASTSGNRIFTLKKILPEFSENEDFIRMFLEEAKISLSLKHSNIVRVLDFGQLEGSYYLAMEYVFGKDLGSILKRSFESKIHIPIDVACYLILQCCRGLHYAHHLVDSFGNSMGIVHRDISPPNILVSYNGDAKILDFGIAKAVRAVQPKITRSGVLKGKFCYMSPEQAQGESLNHQSDVFSLGIVLHELLTSRSLFYSPDEIETLERVRKAKVDPPSKIRKGVPKELDRIVLKALEVKLRKRYASCGEFGDALESFLNKFYPRTDTRSVAKFIRQLFSEEFSQKLAKARKEGWKDIFISGGADDEILLDRSPRATSSSPHFNTQGHQISWWARLLYDPKISQKFYRFSGIMILVLGLGAGAWAFYESQLGRELLKWGKSFIYPTTNQSPGPVDQVQNLSKPEPGSFQWWVNQGDKFSHEKNWTEALEAYDRALRINPYELKVSIARHFVLLEQGDLKEACDWFHQQTEVPEADRLYAEALCHDRAQQTEKALINYTDFLRRFPLDPRISNVQWRVDVLKGKAR